MDLLALGWWNHHDLHHTTHQIVRIIAGSLLNDISESITLWKIPLASWYVHYPSRMAIFTIRTYFHSEYFWVHWFSRETNILATFKTLITQPTRVLGTAHVAVAAKLNPIVVKSSEVRSIIFHHLFIIFQKRIFHHAPPYHRAPLWAFFQSVLPATLENRSQESAQPWLTSLRVSNQHESHQTALRLK